MTNCSRIPAQFQTSYLQSPGRFSRYLVQFLAEEAFGGLVGQIFALEVEYSRSKRPHLPYSLWFKVLIQFCLHRYKTVTVEKPVGYFSMCMVALKYCFFQKLSLTLLSLTIILPVIMLAKISQSKKCLIPLMGTVLASSL